MEMSIAPNKKILAMSVNKWSLFNLKCFAFQSSASSWAFTECTFLVVRCIRAAWFGKLNELESALIFILLSLKQWKLLD